MLKGKGYPDILLKQSNLCSTDIPDIEWHNDDTDDSIESRLTVDMLIKENQSKSKTPEVNLPSYRRKKQKVHLTGSVVLFMVKQSSTTTATSHLNSSTNPTMNHRSIAKMPVHVFGSSYSSAQRTWHTAPLKK
uniref:Uncharacterized protein n=1 Tax=Romanomermis culicivorax TaxID=13658 RepID=A0A915L6H5_ROMCU